MHLVVRYIYFIKSITLHLLMINFHQRHQKDYQNIAKNARKHLTRSPLKKVKIKNKKSTWYKIGAFWRNDYSNPKKLKGNWNDPPFTYFAYLLCGSYAVFQHDKLPIATGFVQFSNCCSSVKLTLLEHVFKHLPLLIWVEVNHVTMLTTPCYIFWLVIVSFFRRIC